MGLHSGAPVHLRILPAPAGTGIVFRRTDLDGFEVEAISRNVAKVSYATSLMKKGVLISTTEHLLSAFIGMGVDNAIVELDNLEVPILDGSALPFVEMITAPGVRQQRRKRVYLKILRPYELHEGDKFIGVYPAERYSVSYAIDFPHPLIGSENFQVELSNGSYVRDIAAARTFGFLEQQQRHAEHGTDPRRFARQLRGADARRDRQPSAAFPDEFVRHKVLDLIGDLALFGKRILGYVKADRAGHALHTAIVSRILRDQSYAEEITLRRRSRRRLARWNTSPSPTS